MFETGCGSVAGKDENDNKSTSSYIVNLRHWLGLCNTSDRSGGGGHNVINLTKETSLRSESMPSFPESMSQRMRNRKDVSSPCDDF